MRVTVLGIVVSSGLGSFLGCELCADAPHTLSIGSAFALSRVIVSEFGHAAIMTRATRPRLVSVGVSEFRRVGATLSGMTMNSTSTASLALKLKASRTLAGFDQQYMADALGVGRSTISGWERGLAEPPASHFVTWAVLTGQPLEWLADGLVRPKGLEPLTFWLGVWTAGDEAAYRQECSRAEYMRRSA